MSYGVGCRCGSDLVLSWLWRRSVATALIRPLAWEPLYTMGVALKRQKRPKKKKILFSKPRQKMPAVRFPPEEKADRKNHTHKHPEAFFRLGDKTERDSWQR